MSEIVQFRKMDQLMGVDDEALLTAVTANSHLEVEKILVNGSISRDACHVALLTACRSGRKYLVQLLVRYGASVVKQDEKEYTALLASAEYGFTEIVRFLLRKGSDVNAQTASGDTALILCVRPGGSYEITLSLINRGAKVNHQNHEGVSALMRALEMGDLEVVKLLIYHGADISAKNKKGESALQMADGQGMGDIVRYMAQAKMTQAQSFCRAGTLMRAALESDARSLRMVLDCEECELEEIDFETRDTVLMRMLKQGKVTVEVMRSLMERRAEMNKSIDDNEGILLKSATQGGRIEFVELVLKYYDKANDCLSESMEIAITNGRYDLLELLVKKAVDMNYSLDCDCVLAVNTALYKGLTDCAKLLFDHGAKVDMETALTLVTDNKDSGGLKFLLENPGHFLNDFSKDGILEYIETNHLIHAAAARADCGIIKVLAEFGTNVNGVDGDGDTPLLKAQNAKTVQFLIDCGADVNKMIEVSRLYDNRTTTALMEATYKNLEEIVHVLVSNGASVDWKDSFGNTPLTQAVERGLTNILRVLLKSTEGVSDYDKRGYSYPLIYAVERSRCDCVEVLLEFGADPNAMDMSGRSPLMIAAEYGDHDLVKLLLSKGSKVNLKNDSDETALSLTFSIEFQAERMREQQRTIAKLLIDAGADVNDASFFVDAIYLGYADIVETCLKRGVDLNMVSIKILPPLMAAVQSPCDDAAREQMVKMLLKSGADRNQQAIGGNTALHGAAAEGHEAEVKLLLQTEPLIGTECDPAKLSSCNKLDLNIKNQAGRTALQVLLHMFSLENPEKAKKQLAIAKLLIESGADVDEGEVLDRVFLTAAIAGEPDVIQACLKKGVDVNTADVSRSTALINAVLSHCDKVAREQVIQLLIDSGANLDMQDSDGKTALHWAATGISTFEMKMLVEAGANVNAVCSENSTALSILLRTRNTEIKRLKCVDFLLQHGATASNTHTNDLFPLICQGDLQRIVRLLDHGTQYKEMIESKSIVIRDDEIMKNIYFPRGVPYHVWKLLSPLCMALCQGQPKIVRYLIDHHLLLKRDVLRIPRNPKLRNYLESLVLEQERLLHDEQRLNLEECLEIYDQLSLQPVPLLTLTFITVSDIIGWEADREDKVKRTGLPLALRNALLFKDQNNEKKLSGKGGENRL